MQVRKRLIIDNEDVDNLPQLDRIEFRMRYKNIKDYYSHSLFLHFTHVGFFIFGFLMLLLVGMINVSLVNDNVVDLIPLFIAMGTFAKIWIWIMFVGFGVDIYFYIKMKKELDRLGEFFFSDEENGKKRK